MKSNITYVAPKGGFTETHKRAFFTKEAAVDALAKGTFYDKYLKIKALFEISEYQQKGLNVWKIAPKLGEKEKFSFCPFGA